MRCCSSSSFSFCRTPRELKRSGLKILEELGKGFFGIVFKGMLKEHANVPGYLVAVKSLNDRVWGREWDWTQEREMVDVKGECACTHTTTHAHTHTHTQAHTGIHMHKTTQ